MHLQLSLYQSVDIVNAPTITTEQHRDKNNDDQSRKSPAQQEVEQIASLCVLVIHHQGLPEVNGLRKSNMKDDLNMEKWPKYLHFIIEKMESNLQP